MLLHFLRLFAFRSAVRRRAAEAVDIDRQERPITIECLHERIDALPDIGEIETAMHDLHFVAGLQIGFEHHETASLLIEGETESVRVMFLLEFLEAIPAIDAKGEEEGVVLAGDARVGTEQRIDDLQRGSPVQLKHDVLFRASDAHVPTGRLTPMQNHGVHTHVAREHRGLDKLSSDAVSMPEMRRLYETGISQHAHTRDRRPVLDHALHPFE